MTEPIKLLCIEDDEVDQQSFIRLVKKRRLPYQYVIVNSLARAYKQLQEQSFDIILCDYLLGDGTAFDLIHAFPFYPIIVVTGAGDEEVAVSVMKAGAKDYLVKDVHGDYLKILPKTIGNTLRLIKLEAAERDQRIFAELLHHTTRILNTTLDLDEIIKLILENIKLIIPHDAANIMLIDDGIARIVQHNGWTAEKAEILVKVEFPVQEIAHLRQIYQTHEPYIIKDISVFDGWIDVSAGYDPCSYVAAPICIDHEVIGFLNLDSMTPHHFNQEHANRLQAFVDQVAVALKNARLYHHAQELAALEERQRLARDLHDSVTQTLFAMTVVSNAIIKQWQRQPDSVGNELLEMRDLSVGALAEMRTLLYELRPNALLEINLGDLLHQLSMTIKGRSRLNVNFITTGECSLPPDVHVAFFRIAQEALNNVVKHAQAKHVDIYLRQDQSYIEVIIRDDGRGFDPSHTTPQSFGISIMRERANKVDITLTISSEQGRGTLIKAIWLNKEKV